jgi:predicted Zn-dependent peptidase
MYEDTPDELVMDVLASQVYGSHPLGYTILGLEENLRSFSRYDLGAYVKQRYVPQNVVISIAGNFSAALALEKLEEQFGGKTFSAKFADSQVVAPKFIVGSSVKIKETEQVHLCLSTPGLAVGDSRLYALVLLNNALGSSSSSRLFQEIREERGMAYSVFSFHSSYRDCGMFGVYAATSPEHVMDTLTLIRGICQDVAGNGLTESEIRKGKEQVKGSMMLSLESTSSRMSRLGKNELMLGREVPLDESIQGIEQVQVQDVKAIAAEILAHPMALAAVGPVANLHLEA